jgi:hypothetical protein
MNASSSAARRAHRGALRATASPISSGDRLSSIESSETLQVESVAGRNWFTDEARTIAGRRDLLAFGERRFPL